MDRSQIIVTQFYTNNIQYGKFSEEINLDYCNKHGYRYICETDTNKIRNGCDGRSFTWYKPKLIKEIFENYNPEYVVFLDADAIFVNRKIQIEDFIDPNYDIIFAQDIGGIGSHSAMNAGVFIIRNTPQSIEFLDKWWNLGDTLKGKDARDLSIMEENLEKSGYFREGLWHDQTCLTYLYEHDSIVHDSLKVISNASFNHYDYNKNGFIFHAFRHGDQPLRTIDIRRKELLPRIQDLPKINLIVYHIFAKNDYYKIVESQVNRLKLSGLYNWCDKMEVTFTGNEKNLLKIKPIFEGMDKVNIVITPDNHYEYYAIHTIWKYSQEYNGKVFYFHTKGVSNKYKNLETQEISDRKIQGIKWWKEVLEHFLIDKWSESVEKLNEFDQCGVTNINGWWWGNFWWSNLSWISNNEEPARGDRWYFEAWINRFRSPSLYEWYHFNFNPYYSKLPLDIYDVDKYKNSTITLVKASYGTLGIQTDEAQPITDNIMTDATEVIHKNFVMNNKKGFHVYVDNNIAGDPNHGYKKQLEITFMIDDNEYILVGDEGQSIKFLL